MPEERYGLAGVRVPFSQECAMSLTSTTCPAARDLELLLAGRLAGPAADARWSTWSSAAPLFLAVAPALRALADPLLEALRRRPGLGRSISAAAERLLAGLISSPPRASARRRQTP